MSQNNKNENRRYVGKVKTQKGQYGDFQKIYIDNPNPTNKDGSANKFHEGVLLWLDNATGKKFLVKQFSVRGAPEKAKAHGFHSSISIDLDSEYEVQELG